LERSTTDSLWISLENSTIPSQFFFLGHRFSLQVYFRNLLLSPNERFVFCMCVFFIWKCCIDSWINGMRGHAVCTAATIQETVEGNKNTVRIRPKSNRKRDR